LVGRKRKVAVEHRSHVAGHHKNNGGIQGSEAIPADDVLILITVDVESESLSAIERTVGWGGFAFVKVKPPKDVVGVDDISCPDLAKQIEGDVEEVRLLGLPSDGAVVIIVDGPRLVGVALGVEADEGDVEIGQIYGRVAGSHGLVEGLELGEGEIRVGGGVGEGGAGGDGLGDLTVDEVVDS
jgi:hypothetical protein